MSKYTKEELRQMAIETLEAKRRGDPRFEQLLEQMIDRTGLSVDDVEIEIFKLAVGP